MSISSLTP